MGRYRYSYVCTADSKCLFTAGRSSQITCKKSSLQLFIWAEKKEKKTYKETVSDTQGKLKVGRQKF